MKEVVQASKRFVLASRSPARLVTLRAAGIEPEVIVSGVDENDVGDVRGAAEHALVLARRKAQAVSAQLEGESALVLGCDSVLEFDGEVLGKPGTVDEALKRWRRMRGGAGVLHTGHCVVQTDTGRMVEAAASTGVRFADLSDAEVEAYVATGEPLEVAGAFTIDGLGGAFVERVDGDHHNVVGVSLPLLRRLLGELGVFWPDLWNRPR
ncbi:Maf family protein [Actinopolymorpha pittospori]